MAECKRLKQYIYDELRVEISALEIYCDTVKDLFSDKPVKLMADKNNVLKLEGQTWRSAVDTKSFLESIKFSASKRVFGENGVNNHSSRSHHIF